MPLTIIIVLQWTVAAFYSNFLAICEWSFHDSRLFTAIGIYISNFRIHNGACWHFASMLPIYLYCHASTTRGGGSTTRDTRNCLWTGRVFREFALGDLRRRFEKKRRKRKEKGWPEQNTGKRRSKTLISAKSWIELSIKAPATCVGTIRESTARTYPKFNILGDGPH